jgi:hypothetical protein
VHDVTKHDCEQEWECNAGKNCWVSLFVGRNTVSIYDLLENPTELCLSKVGWAG